MGGVVAGWPARALIASSSIALPLELNDAWKLFSPWILYRKHLARNLFGICCILLGQRIVPNRDRVVQKRWSCKVVGRDQFSQGDPGLCWGRSAFPIVDLTFHEQWHSFGVQCQPSCSGSFAWLGSHPSLATRTDATVKVVLATWHKWSAKLCLLFGPFVGPHSTAKGRCIRITTLGQPPASRL